MSDYDEESDVSDYEESNVSDYDESDNEENEPEEEEEAVNKNIIVYSKSGRIFNPNIRDWPSIYEARLKIKHIETYNGMIEYLRSIVREIKDESKMYYKRLLVLMATESLLKLKTLVDFDVFESKNQRFIDLMIEKISEFSHLRKYKDTLSKLSYKNNLKTRKKYVSVVLRRTILPENVIYNITELID